MATAKEQIENFYKKKKAYDSKFNNTKYSILHNEELTMEEKRAAVKKIKPKCLGCKRSVGTIFTPSVGRVKEAKCGDTENPCKYHVKINNGEFSYAPDLLEGLNHDIKLYQLNISKIKYNLLFGLVTEESMAQSFDEMKTKYRDLIISKKMVEDFLHKFDSITVDSGEGLEPVAIDKQTYAKTKQNELEQLISDFRSYIDEYNKSNTGDTKRGFMNDAIDLYLNRIIPVMEIIRKTLYEISTVMKSKGEYKLIQKYRSLKNLVMETEPVEFDDEVGERLAAFDENFTAAIPEEKSTPPTDIDDDDEFDDEDPWITMDGTIRR